MTTQSLREQTFTHRDDVILAGVVGSTAYGLNRPDSDVDRLGVYTAPIDSLFGLYPPRETFVRFGPDVTYHEAAKMCRLLMSCNPSVVELLWLPEDLYEVKTPLGQDLVDMRHAFLSAAKVRNAYLGYATSQFERLFRRPAEPAGDRQHKLAKNARHILRLLDQGLQLYSTGLLTVKVDDPQRYFDFGVEVANQPLQAEATLGAYEDRFDAATSPLRQYADVDAINNWLVALRHDQL